MENRKYAKRLLKHYFSLAVEDIHSDNYAEIELIVDAIIEAAVEAAVEAALEELKAGV